MYRDKQRNSNIRNKDFQKPKLISANLGQKNCVTKGAKNPKGLVFSSTKELKSFELKQQY